MNDTAGNATSVAVCGDLVIRPRAQLFNRDRFVLGDRRGPNGYTNHGGDYDKGLNSGWHDDAST